MHWLAQIAQRAGLARAESLDIPADASTPMAWAGVEQHCGLGEDELVRAVAAAAGLEVANLADAHPPARRLVPDRIARRWAVIPLRETDKHIVVATSDPSNVEAEQAIAFASGRRVLFEIASPAMLHAALAVPGQATAPASKTPVNGAKPVAPGGLPLDAAGVAQLADKLIADAIAAGASDVQLEPARTGGIVRFRVDGVVRPYAEYDATDFERLVARVKAMARLATAVRTRPQEGRIKLAAGPAAGLELRVATIPTRDGERATVRIPTPGDARSLEDLDAMPDDLARLRELVTARAGLVLVCGAQTSGRTTTAYALAREIVARGTPVTSIEDPIESCVPGVSQMQVDMRTGLTVAALTREAMAADGAAILVGELRDRETADLAVQAATTGHLVVAVLQASSALGAIDRLGELGLGRTRIAAALHGVAAQQLLRRVCAACGGKSGAPACTGCGGSGLRGRVPVFEIVAAQPPLRELIADGAPPSALQRHMAAVGSRSLHDDAAARVAAGHTTHEEAERVLGAAPRSAAGTRSAETRRILVADDDEIARHLACTLLAQQGFEPHEASDGAVAIELLSSERRFAAVVLDLHMPRVDGRSVLGHIRRTPNLAALPVIVLTGSCDSSTEVEVIDAGADDYLSKPADPPRFLARVRAVLRRAAA